MMRWLGAVLVLGTAACARAEHAPARADAIAAIGPRGIPADSFPEASRPVASIVTDTWSSEDERDSAGEAEKVMDLLAITPGMTVADVGAGSGYYTVRLSPRVGPQGKVIAQDIVARYLDGLRRRVRTDSLRNVQLALGEPHDPRLPRASVDLVMLVHMYHEVEQPYAFLANLRPSLRPGGRVAVVDLDRATQNHGTPLSLLECEFRAVGYTRTATHDLGGGSGYLAVFQPTDGPAPWPSGIRPCPAPSAGER